jgi:hypothetical protein
LSVPTTKRYILRREKLNGSCIQYVLDLFAVSIQICKQCSTFLGFGGGGGGLEKARRQELIVNLHWLWRNHEHFSTYLSMFSLHFFFNIMALP